MLFFQSSWCKSSNSSNRPDGNHPILPVVLVQIIQFFQSSWWKSSYSSSRPSANHPIFPIVLMEIILFFQSFLCKSSNFTNRPGGNHPILPIILVENSYSVARNWINLSRRQQRQLLPALLYESFFYEKWTGSAVMRRFWLFFETVWLVTVQQKHGTKSSTYLLYNEVLLYHVGAL